MNRATSTYLDIIRPLAALMVMLSHVSYAGLTLGQLSFMRSVGGQAVDIFFVLSGFVIAHVCATAEQDARGYFVSRAARIYSVAIPALILTFALDAIGIRADPSTYADGFQTFGPGLLARSLLFIGEQWNAHRFPGSDGPYWSLGFEVWYYVAFGAYVFAPARMRWWAMSAVLAFIGPKVALMFPAWLMGVACHRLRQRHPRGRTSGWLLFGSSILLLAGYQFMPHSASPQFAAFSFSSERLLSTAQDYGLALVFSMNIVGFAAISDFFAPWLARRATSIRWIAGGTFTLYLMHLPIMFFLASISPWPKSSAWTLALLLVATPIACMALAEISERRKTTWRKIIMATTNRWVFA